MTRGIDMRWLPVVVISALLIWGGCNRSESTSATTSAPPQSAATTGPAWPVVLVDARHAATEAGDYRPYVVDSRGGVILDANHFALRDPKNLARFPNSVHVIYDRALYVAAWPTGGKQVVSLDAVSLAPRKGEPFSGFAEGKQAYVAIGFEEPSSKGGEVEFTPFWVGSMLFH